MCKDFKIKMNEIVLNLENTNYGSLIAQMRIILCFQELILKNELNKEELLLIFKNLNFDVAPDLKTSEVYIEVMGEIGMNLDDSHRCKPIWDDLGESYIIYLMEVIRRMKKSGTLFSECNN